MHDQKIPEALLLESKNQKSSHAHRSGYGKRLGITVDTFVMIYNVVLYVIAGIVMGSWILPLYSIVTYYAGLKTIDFIVEGLDRSKAAMIVTTLPDEVCTELSREFECGATRIEATGSYSGEARTVVYFVVNRFQIGKMKAIGEIDRKVYITIAEVADVFRANR